MLRSKNKGKVKLIVHCTTGKSFDQLNEKYSADEFSSVKIRRRLDYRPDLNTGIYLLRRDADYIEGDSPESFMKKTKRFVAAQNDAIYDSDIVVAATPSEITIVAEMAGKPVYFGHKERGIHEIQNREHILGNGFGAGIGYQF